MLQHAGPSGAPLDYDANIYYGTPTSDFPAVVGLAMRNRNGTTASCSGTLIEPSTVLTAAHCLSFDPIGIVAVVFPNATTRVDHVASGFLVHPRFDITRFAYADVAIVRLATPVDGVDPIPLAHASPAPGTNGTIVGYGDDGRGRRGTKMVGTVRLRRCPRLVHLRTGKLRIRKSLCWRPADLLHDTCRGDSGGPLIVDGAVAGITSGGIGATDCPAELSFDTNVVRFRKWIGRALSAAP
jgi:trypsin